jgi:hypothetical protein
LKDKKKKKKSGIGCNVNCSVGLCNRMTLEQRNGKTNKKNCRMERKIKLTNKESKKETETENIWKEDDEIMKF